MRNFQRICTGLHTMPLAHALARQPELWDRDKLRTTHSGTPHSQVSDIWLRFNDLTGWENKDEAARRGLVLDEHESINYPAFALLPQARIIIWDLMRLVEGERLGRVLITRLGPGKVITPHVDGGSHAAYYDRYHVALASLPGVVFRAGEEAVQMATGEVWWFDNSKEHEVVNNSGDDRITMIVDIKTAHAHIPGPG